MVDRARVDLLARTELFRHFTEAALVQIAPHFTERRYRRGQLLFHQNDPGDSLWVLAEGLVKVTVTSPMGDEMLLVTLTPPETFGELSLIDRRPRSASVEVLEPARVFILGEAEWTDLLKNDFAFTQAVLRSVADMVRRLTDQASDFAFLDLHGRVAKLLVRFADESRLREGEAIVLDLGLTQTDIARMVGGSRQSINQILHALQGRGYIELRRQKIYVKKIIELRRRAGL